MRAKAPYKREATGDEVRRAGYRLTHAVGQMQRRAEEEDNEGQLFYVDDDIYHPSFLSDQPSVSVRYRWRKATDDEWAHGSITFTHVVDSRPDFRVPVPKRKPSAAQQDEARHEKRYQAWEDLMKISLYSVRDFFRAGGEGNNIPDTFRAIVDHSGFLNNYSARFWSTPPKP